MYPLQQDKHNQLLSILLSKRRFHNQLQPMSNYCIDLILVVDIPTSPQMIPKNQVFPLSMMRKKISPATAQTYKQALSQTQVKIQSNYQIVKYIQNIGGLQKQEEEIIPIKVETNLNTEEDVVKYNYVGTGVKDLFTVNLNMVIYTLQKECGFNVEKYIINDKVFLLLNCQQENLRRAAVLHKIKKQVVYSEVDIYLNEPLDSKNRPIILNKKLKRHQRMRERRQQNTQQRLTYFHKSIDEQLLKMYHRKLGDVQNYSNEIIDEVSLSVSEIQKFQVFMKKYLELLEMFDLSPIKYQLTDNQRNYVRKVLNKGQEPINEGALKIFLQIKRRRDYFQKITELVDTSGYKVFVPTTIYTSFFELNKKKKYSDRVKSLLMFKPLVTGPQGELQMFSRMERTRLAYLIVLEYFRIQNFPLYGIEFYTLHNSFQKSGQSSREIMQGIEGGLDGRNLEKSWSVFTPWKSDIKIIRDYLGESFAYFTFLKNRLILALMIFSPIALIAFLIIILVLPLNLTRNSHLDTFVFFTTYAFVILIWFSAYSIRQDQSQAFHFGTLRQTSQKTTPNFGYKSPYVRNLITDSVNQYREVKSIFNRFKQFLGLLFVLALLCIDIGIFYGIRSWSIVLKSQMSRSNLFFEWYTFIPLFFFFMGNHIVYMFGLKKLFRFITSLENNPNLEKDESSTEVKCLLFRIGVELIGPIDLMVVEALGTHNCYDSSCWNAYQSFINVRFIVVFIILIIRFLTFLIEKLIARVKSKKETQKDLKQVQQNRQQQSQVKKLFMKIIKQYSKREYSIDIEQQILILVQSALFSVIQPINTLINLFLTLLDFYLERLQILKGCRRPINTAMSTPNYSVLIKVPFYIFCAFNSWMLIVNFEDLQYVNPHFYLFFLKTPTKDAITTLKILFSLGLFCLMLLFEYIFRKIYNNNNEYSELIARKKSKLANYLHKYKKIKGGNWNSNRKPIVHIGRVSY